MSKHCFWIISFEWLFHLDGHKFHVDLISINRFIRRMLRILIRQPVAYPIKWSKSKNNETTEQQRNPIWYFAHGCNIIIIIIECHCSLLLTSEPWLRTPLKRDTVMNSIRYFVSGFFLFVSKNSSWLFSLIAQRHKCTKCARCSRIFLANETKNMLHSQTMTFTYASAHAHTHTRSIANHIIFFFMNAIEPRIEYDFLLSCVQHTSNPCQINQINTWFGTKERETAHEN